MKKIFFTITLFSISAISIFAQGNKNEDPEQTNRTDYREKLLFGFKAGTNYANVYNVKAQEFTADAKFGFATGVFVAIPLGKLLGIQPEVLFSQKGFKGNGVIKEDKYTFSRTNSYLDIPLMLAIKPTEFITILAGPQYAYLMSQKDVITFGNTSVADETGFSNSNLRKNTLGFIVSVR